MVVCKSLKGLPSLQENCGSCGLLDFTRTGCRICEEVQVGSSVLRRVSVMCVEKQLTLQRCPVLSQGLLLAQWHPGRDAAAPGQKHPHEDPSGRQDQPPWHHAGYARHLTQNALILHPPQDQNEA